MDQNKLDFICVGRANVDLYAVEPNVSLKKTTGFRKSIGGSPANIAVALSRLGAKVGFIGKVSDDAFGNYVLEFLREEGVQLSHLSYASDSSRTSLAFAEVKAPQSKVLFYRKEAADLELSPQDIEEAYIKSCKRVVLSGTAFSHQPSRDAMLAIMEYAQKHQSEIVLDLDYRPSQWRDQAEAIEQYLRAVEQANLIIGNKEEFQLLGVPQQELFNGRTNLIICKYGEQGSEVITAGGVKVAMGIFPVRALKPYGSGDAFAAAFLYATVMEGWDLEKSLRWASAAGAILVSRFGCAEAMPFKDEIEGFIQSHAYRQPSFDQLL